MLKCICQVVQLIGASLHMSTNTVCDAMYAAVRERALWWCGVCRLCRNRVELVLSIFLFEVDFNTHYLLFSNFSFTFWFVISTF